jgi:hypothetical protein
VKNSVFKWQKKKKMAEKISEKISEKNGGKKFQKNGGKISFWIFSTAKVPYHNEHSSGCTGYSNTGNWWSPHKAVRSN